MSDTLRHTRMVALNSAMVEVEMVVKNPALPPLDVRWFTAEEAERAVRQHHEELPAWPTIDPAMVGPFYRWALADAADRMCWRDD